MKFRLRNLLILNLFISVPAVAEEYKDPSTFTREEYQMVFDAKADYQQCLQEESLKIIQQSNDPRQVADVAMKTCASILEKLYTQITLRNYSPDVAKKFTRRISNRESNKLLSNLMQYMAIRSTQATPETTQAAPAVIEP